MLDIYCCSVRTNLQVLVWGLQVSKVSKEQVKTAILKEDSSQPTRKLSIDTLEKEELEQAITVFDMNIRTKVVTEWCVEDSSTIVS